ncbi:TIM barrel protein [Robinsoniella sp.]|uniref:TIM barrel protein n=1 Tax=Robinsoniella sp. TaxID=2496533 RepID=UPI003753B5F9
MLNIGSHLSSAKGFLHLGKDALKIDANTFQFFLRNPRGTRAKAMNQEDVDGLRNFLAEHHFAPIVAHAPYTLNPCSSNAHVRDLAQEMFHDDLLLMKQLPGNYYNFHPGSHLGQDMDTAVSFISSMLNWELQPGQPTMVLLETMSWK